MLRTRRRGSFRPLVLLGVVLIFAVVCAVVPVESQTTPTEKILHAFSGGSDGAVPYAGLVADSRGNLYGTTQQGGKATCSIAYVGCGTVFELTFVGDLLTGHWAESVLYNFHGADGANPSGPLVMDKLGNLYGTTYFGGNLSCGFYGCGTVFELEKSAGGWSEHVLHYFSGGADGLQPTSGLIFDAAGNLYGTTAFGGDANCSSSRGSPGCGVVFELHPFKAGWAEKVLHTFHLNDGANPYQGVTLDTAGNLYGTTYAGGKGSGLVFELVHSGGRWTEVILQNFPGNIDDGTPNAGVTLDQTGNVYGTTHFGGAYGGGSVFELTDSGGIWTETLVLSFTGGYDGGYPNSGVIFDANGNLYGAASLGGTGYSCPGWCGVVFKLEHGTWTETVLHDFQGGTDGEFPSGNLLIDLRGNLYGTTQLGGDQNCQVYPPNSGCGVVFEISGAVAFPTRP